MALIRYDKFVSANDIKSNNRIGMKLSIRANKTGFFESDKLQVIFLVMYLYVVIIICK